MSQLVINMPYDECVDCDAIELETSKMTAELLNDLVYVVELRHRCKREDMCRDIRLAQIRRKANTTACEEVATIIETDVNIPVEAGVNI